MYLSRENQIMLNYNKRVVIEIIGFLNDSFLPLMLNGKVPVGFGLVGDSKLVSGFH